MMEHCDEIVALSLAECLGGPPGYNLMLSVVKSGLSILILGWFVTETDVKYILRASSVILHQKGLMTDTAIIPYNVYTQRETMLSPCLLDSQTTGIGQYLITKYLCQQISFGLEPGDIPDVSEITGPLNLLDKVKKMKGVTLNRTRVKNLTAHRTEREIQEEKKSKESVQNQKAN